MSGVEPSAGADGGLELVGAGGELADPFGGALGPGLPLLLADRQTLPTDRVALRQLLEAGLLLATLRGAFGLAELAELLVLADLDITAGGIDELPVVLGDRLDRLGQAVAVMYYDVIGGVPAVTGGEVVDVAGKIHPAECGDAVERDLAGETSEKADSRIRRGLLPTPDDLIPRYRGGESELALSKSYGISRIALRRMLVDGGAEIRGRSEAGKNRASKMTAEERKSQVSKAHDAVRGKAVEESVLVKAAQARQMNPRPPSTGERKLLAMLRKRGLRPHREVAVGRYNVDLAVPGVAVEVLGGKWHGYKATHHRRTKAILDAGWHIIFVWNHDRVPLDAGAADYIVGFCEETGRHPSSVREYRVIRGDGELVSSGSADDDELTRIPPATKTSRRRGVRNG